MLKRGITILIFFLYTLGISGVAFAFHYCGGDLQSIFLHDSNEDGCCGDEDMDDGCCKDKVLKFKKFDDRIHADKLTIAKALFTDFDIVPAFEDRPICPAQQYSHPVALVLRPPLLRTGGPPLYILHSVFRI